MRVEVLLRSVTIKQLWVGFYYLQELRNAYVFLYVALSDGVLGFIPLTLFTQNAFKMVLFEMIRTYPRGHAT